MSERLAAAAEVADVLRDGRAVVALETTLVSVLVANPVPPAAGMPLPAYEAAPPASGC
jgi:hypothetical protein